MSYHDNLTSYQYVDFENNTIRVFLGGEGGGGGGSGCNVEQAYFIRRNGKKTRPKDSE
jgi:hypothetical protein